MAAKDKSVYVCSECGYETPKWYGQCPGCGSWNTMSEEVKTASFSKKSGGSASSKRATAYKLTSITTDEEIRYKTGLNELDRVLGGGLVKGSLVLLSGDPGIGKSTILLQICQFIGKNLKILYVSGEESANQIKLRADRLGVYTDNLEILCDSDMEYICDSKAALLCYATPTPQIDEPSAGYIFTWDMLGNGAPVAFDQFEGEAGTHSEFVEGLMSSDMKKTCDDLAVFLKDCV